jgi:hypothetical protein
MDTVRFISIEDDHPDLILSFALDDEQTGVRSLILIRTPKYEDLLDEHKRGVSVSLEGDEEYEHNLLESISIEDGIIKVVAQRSEYKLDIGRVDDQEIKEMLEMLTKMNFDSSFEIDIVRNVK